jgi:ArsR family transcriptional regulator
VARVLRPGGGLLIADMTPHEREEYRQQMGHVWLGFTQEQIAQWAQEGGLEAPRYRALPADPTAKGPTLFAASARKPE